MFEYNVSCKRFIRVPAAVFNLPLISAQMLSDNVAEVVYKDIELCLILGIIRFDLFERCCQQFNRIGVAEAEEGIRQQILQFFTVCAAVRESFP